MRILVISDTHGKNERVYDVYNKLASAGGPAARSGGLSGGTFALVTTSEAGLQAKIYYYEDFMLPAAGVGSTGGGADAPDNSAADNSAAGGSASAPETPASPAASPVAPAVRKQKQKPKVKGGHLRSLINYSDRF